MDHELLLAQLLNEYASDNSKLQILEDMVVTYTISGKCSAFQVRAGVLDYNCLHIAATKSDSDLTRTLENLGTNVLLQGFHDGKTTLHKAIDYVNDRTETSVWKRMGVLRGGLLNILLSAQVKSGNSLNAKCKNGISHLHIACMCNHTETVWFFARFNESLDQAISIDSNILPGYTPLHCAIRYSSSETAVFLMTLGADIYLKNAQGMSSVCYLIERLLDVNDYLKMVNISYYYCNEKEMERLDSILKVIVLKNRTDDSELIENVGVSAFHLACTLKDTWIMQSYIGWSFKDINKPVKRSKLWAGWTPLHFAVCCNIQSFGILLTNGADISMKNVKGETAFDLCLRRYNIEIPLSYLSIEFLLSDEVTKLADLMVVMSEYNVCQKFLQDLKDINLSVPLESPFWSGYNLLHLSVLMIHRVRLSDAFHQQIDYCSKTGHLMSVSKRNKRQDLSSSWARFENIWRKGCCVHTKSADGLTPIHLAFQLDEWHALEELLACAHRNVVGPGNLSILHIACAMGKIDVVERLLKNGTDINNRVTEGFERYWKPQLISLMSYQNKLRRVLIRANSTPLHIAVLFKTNIIVRVLLEKDADVHAKDELGFTPLHLSLIVSNKYAARLLFHKMLSSLRDVRTKDGLSYLHVAAFADDENAVKKLLRDGADVNGFIIRDAAPECLADFIGKTPLHLAVGCEKVARDLIENGANIYAENPSCIYETPLDLAIRQFKYSVIFEKLKHKVKLDALTASGLTSLHVACAIWDLDWTRKLLSRGANPNVRISNAKGQANTPMHMVIVRAISAHSIPENFRLFLKLLIEYGADISIGNNCETPMHLMASAYFENRLLDYTIRENEQWEERKAVFLSIADWLLSNQRSYALNPTNADGFSHFHFACVTNNVAAVKKYLDSGIGINDSTNPLAKNHGGFTPLHFAIKHQNIDIVQMLLKRGADVRIKGSDGNTPLHLAIEHLMNFQLFDTLLRKGADINAKNVKGQTPILYLLSLGNVTYKQFRFFGDRGSLIDITVTINGQGIIGYTMEQTKISDIESVIENFIELADLENAINQGFLAIHSVVSARAGYKLTREHYLNVFQRLSIKGSDIDEEDENGIRALDKAISFDNSGAIEALLLLGVSVNVIEDKNGLSSIIQKSFYHCRGKVTEVLLPESRMTNHLQKMALVNLDLNDSIQKVMKNLNQELDYKTMHVCESELKKIEETKIWKSLTAKHFLSEWGAIIDYPTMSIAERQAVDKFFKRFDNLRKEFPEFAGLLMMQYRKALLRVKLMQPVKDILVAAGIELPDLCLEAILEYFKNSELNFLIENADKLTQCHAHRTIYQIN